MQPQDFERVLFKHLDQAFDTVWNQEHCGPEFAESQGVKSLSDVFQYKQMTQHEVESKMKEAGLANGEEFP
jgi:hypothetical protein